MLTSQRTPWPLYLIVASAVLVIFVVAVTRFENYTIFPNSLSSSDHSSSKTSSWWSHVSHTGQASSSPTSWTFNSEQDSLNYGLSDEQCDAAFPGLFQEPDRARDWHSKRGIHQSDVKIWNVNNHGQVHVLIYHGQIYILNAHWAMADKSRAKAALASLYRSIVALPDPRSVPNIEFILDIADDQGDSPENRSAWAWARRTSQPDPWVMPDFDGWSYSDDDVGAYEVFRTKVRAIERPFEEKIPQAVWRGSAGVNHDLRQALLDATVEKPWADVKELNWATKEGFMSMEDFCKYQYTVQTEGNSWSGRLRYLHNCLSVPVIHDLEWVAHYYPLLEPSGPHQNYIPVHRNFSNLEEQMNYYLSHPAEAEALAHESATTFRDRYLTPAAEACYWRRMVRNWAEVQRFEPKLWKKPKMDENSTIIEEYKMRGISFERWAFRAEVSGEHGIAIPNDPIPEFEEEEDY